MEILCDEVEIVIVFVGFIESIYVGVVQDTQDFYLIFEDIGVFDEPFVDDLHAPFRVGRLLESGLINGAVSTSADGLPK